MARGTQHRKRRPATNAGAPRGRASVAAEAEAPKRKQKPPQWQEELFFSRLRVHAKWMFVLLALVFGLGFVIFGVGSGSTGISDALQNAFHFGSSGGASISGLQKKTAQHPTDATAWRDLATAYEDKGRTADAVSALERYVALKPNDTDALTDLAGRQTQVADADGTQLQQLEVNASVLAPQSTFAPPASSIVGKVANPILTAQQQSLQTQAQALQSKLEAADAAAEATYRRLAKLNPDDASTQLSLGQAAQTANDTATAVAAYKRFLQLAPDDPLASQVKQALKALEKTNTTTGTGSTAGG